MLARLVAPLLQTVCTPRAWRFARGLSAVEATQRQTLQRIVSACASTDFARHYGLREDDDREAFRRKLPISDHANVAGWIAQQQRNPTHAAIAPGRVRCFEPTSGSSGKMKLIPYNDALLRSFRSLFAIWAHDLLRFQLRPRSGRAFMSISPNPIRLTAEATALHGLEDDRDYLGGVQRALIGRFLLTPSAQPADSVEVFRRQLALDLILCRDLEVISVWHPGYLLVLMDYVESRDPLLLSALPAAQRRVLENEAAPWSLLWPSLQLISCWNSAAAALPARQLAQHLPQAMLQGKGLLATEAPITLPLHTAGGCVPLVDEVFLEFEREGGRIDLLHELQSDIDYAVIVTQSAGLLRYRLGDRVRVDGRYHDAPLLAFVGRADAVSDLVGEKLHEDFVSNVLTEVFDSASFFTLVPVLPMHGRPFYVCLTDAVGVLSAAQSVRVDEALQQAMRYAEARALVQLDCVQVVAMPEMRRRVQDHFTTCGMRLGDIKERRLITSLEVAQRLYAAIAPLL